jgi:hypothetical protein
MKANEKYILYIEGMVLYLCNTKTYPEKCPSCVAKQKICPNGLKQVSLQINMSSEHKYWVYRDLFSTIELLISILIVLVQTINKLSNNLISTIAQA